MVIVPSPALITGLTGFDQLWVADITYIRLREQFLCLAVILDAYLILVNAESMIRKIMHGSWI